MDAWEEQDGALVREFAFPSFRAAIDFVVRLADLAESEDHHPDGRRHPLSPRHRPLDDPLRRRDHRS